MGLSWTILVLISKVNAYTQGIGLIGVLFKVVEVLSDTCIKAVVMFHDILHGFFSSRGMGTAIMELNMAQEIASIDQYLLFLVFLYFSKSYNMTEYRIVYGTRVIYD